MEEVSNVVKTYYEVIGKKDEDIFELYRDNRRLQKQLDETLTGEEDREAERRILKLLVAALQTELKEKHLFIQEQERERNALQSALVRAREALNMNSELDHPANDVVDSLIAHYMMCYELQTQLRALLQVSINNCTAARFMLMENEERERRIIAETSELSYTTIVSSAQHTQAAIIQRDLLRLEYEDVEREHRQKEELVRKQHLVEHHRQERLLEMWQEKANTAVDSLMLHQTLTVHERKEKELLMEGASARLDLMAEQSADLLRILAFIFRSFRRFDEQLQEAHGRAAEAQKKREKMQISLSQARACVRVLQHPERTEVNTRALDKSDFRDRTDEGSPHPLSLLSIDRQGECADLHALREEHAALKTEWQKYVERERMMRQQLVLATNRHRVERDDLEAKAAEEQRRHAVLTVEVKRTKKDMRQRTKEVRQLQQQLQDVRMELERSVDRCRDLEGLNDTLKEKNTVLQDRVETQQKEHALREEQLQDQVRTKETWWDEKNRTYQEHIASLQKQLRDDKDGFLKELKEWTVVLDDAQRKIAAAEGERDKERALRCMMEEQHRDEIRLIKNVTNNEKMKLTRALQKKIGKLEMACRRSADVIAELREALHRSKGAAVDDIML
ncbi:hypothetical protein, conserved [Trypanosoma brucei gambiense DAL972]|uniref:Uncharacterized protein n=1 Tax=Trypanosoma brucei gambiense (strain MHOM/CI/86/DAL972) TaxID=679716 RepID=D0A859_TRYB9|nr:hypothetical protein, conserved [Trypanosoma brucei gambiense DAL972]CBH17860.1 hypothetical protein, conserved [Trypanosoma brucei gambiense DAL972]|eukprot:XP_011780124.1 hypothetical protein, conserved [Trypanosoma brucei gambiense DAL972]